MHHCDEIVIDTISKTQPKCLSLYKRQALKDDQHKNSYITTNTGKLLLKVNLPKAQPITLFCSAKGVLSMQFFSKSVPFDLLLATCQAT